MPDVVLVTGSDGYVGRLIMRSVLQDPHASILALPYRNTALPLALDSQADASRVRVLEPIEGTDFKLRIEALRSENITEVWNSYASLSHDVSRFRDTFLANSVLPLEMLKRLPSIRSFNQISTIGVSGANGGIHRIGETLQFPFDPMSPYTVSKLMAELLVAQHIAENTNAIQASIVRLGNLIGDSKSGEYTGARHGYYSFLDMLVRARRRKRDLVIDLSAEGVPAVVHSDHFCALVTALRSRRNSSRPLEIINAVSPGVLTAADHVAAWNSVSFETSPVLVRIGKPTDAFSKAFCDVNADNLAFFSSQTRYDNDNFLRFLPKVDTAKTSITLKRIVENALWSMERVAP